MNYITHSIGGLGAGLGVISTMSPLDEISTATIISGAILGSLLPDIDHTKSFIGRKVPIASHVISATFKHRGFLHTPVFIAIVAIIIMLSVPMIGNPAVSRMTILFAKGLIPGMVSHILLDSFNKGGISWLWPFSAKRYRILSVRTDSIMESIFTVCLASIVVFCFFK